MLFLPNFIRPRSKKLAVSKPSSFELQALLQAHDVVAHEVYAEDTSQITPDQSGHFQNGVDDKEREQENGGEITEVTRIRLVQFVKNTNEPLVC